MDLHILPRVLSAYLTAHYGAILGMGVASTFIELLAGKGFVAFAGIELGFRNQEDDGFSEIRGLV